MEKLKKVISWPVILGIQVIATLIILFSIFKLNILPTTYAVMVGMILVLFCFINFALMKPDKKSHHHHHQKTKLREIIGKILSLLLSVLMVFGSVMINKGYSTLDDITNSNTKSTHYTIVVLKSSKINSLSELKNESIEYCLQYDEEKDMNEVIAEAKKKESSLNFDVAMTYSKLGDDLYNNTVNAILINTAYNGMFEDNHPEFENETKEIWSSDIEAKVKDFSTRVSVTNTPFTIYISGIDTYGSISTVSRSDVNIIMTVNMNTHKILLTTTPRDAYVKIPGGGADQYDKLTHAGIYGVETSEQTLENLYGIKIDYYARINFTSFLKLIDQLGGVTVHNDQAFTSLHGKFDFPVGDIQMNSEQALGFVRERYSLDGGDNDRGKNQEKVISAIVNKLASLNSVSNFTSIVNNLQDSVQTLCS